MRHTLRAAFGLLLVLAVSACSGTRPSSLGLHGNRLAPCPDTPNCVASDAGDAEHAIEPLRLSAEPAQAWQAARAAVEALPRTRIVTATAEYLHAECTSRIFRFVDDLELHLRAADGIIDVRSASRIGRSDFGVNRERVESLREDLRRRGVVR